MVVLPLEFPVPSVRGNGPLGSKVEGYDWYRRLVCYSKEQILMCQNNSAFCKHLGVLKPREEEYSFHRQCIAKCLYFLPFLSLTISKIPHPKGSQTRD